MTDIEVLLADARSLGADFELNAIGVAIEYTELLPAETMANLREHKAEIIAHLLRVKYRQVFENEDLGNDELIDLERRVKEQSVCLCWSELLQDYVAFCRTEVHFPNVPPGFVCYSLNELEYNQDMTPESFVAIHRAKKLGMKITDNRQEEISEGNP